MRHTHMQRLPVRIVAIVALILAALLILTRRTPAHADGQTETSSQRSDASPAPTTTRPADKARPTGSTSYDPHPDSPRLVALKKRWLALSELDPSLATTYAERDKLSEESARTLLCSEDTIELILFLREKNIDNVVEIRVEGLFKSDLAAEARQSLVALPNKPSADSINYRMQLSREAGEGCSPDDFQAFSTALADPACSQEAYFGQQVALAKTDPTGALEATLAQLDKGLRSNSSGDSINRLISALPPQTDFAEIDSLLPHTEPTGPERSSTYAYTSSSLISQWSKSDPSAAAHHIMEHPDRYPVSKFETPVMDILTKDLATGIEWIQELPEGPYFDQAASVAITRLIDAGKPKEAHLLASQISNPERREALMKAALGPPPRYEESDQDKE